MKNTIKTIGTVALVLFGIEAYAVPACTQDRTSLKELMGGADACERLGLDTKNDYTRFKATPSPTKFQAFSSMCTSNRGLNDNILGGLPNLSDIQNFRPDIAGAFAGFACDFIEDVTDETVKQINDAAEEYIGETYEIISDTVNEAAGTDILNESGGTFQFDIDKNDTNNVIRDNILK